MYLEYGNTFGVLKGGYEKVSTFSLLTCSMFWLRVEIRAGRPSICSRPRSRFSLSWGSPGSDVAPRALSFTSGRSLSSSMSFSSAVAITKWATTSFRSSLRQPHWPVPPWQTSPRATLRSGPGVSADCRPCAPGSKRCWDDPCPRPSRQLQTHSLTRVASARTAGPLRALHSRALSFSRRPATAAAGSRARSTRLPRYSRTPTGEGGLSASIG